MGLHVFLSACLNLCFVFRSGIFEKQSRIEEPSEPRDEVLHPPVAGDARASDPIFPGKCSALPQAEHHVGGVYVSFY